MNLPNYTPLIRISLIVTILSCLAIGGLNIVKVREKVRNLQVSLREQTAGREKAEAEAVGQKRALDGTLVALKEAQASVETSKAEKDQALAAAAAQRNQADRLRQNLAETHHQLINTGAELERYKLAGMAPEQIMNAVTQIKGLRHSLAAAENENNRLRKEINELADVLHPGRDPVVT